MSQDEPTLKYDEVVRRSGPVRLVVDLVEGHLAARHGHFGQQIGWQAGVGLDMDRQAGPCFDQPQHLLD
jgi:hypothetical protein